MNRKTLTLGIVLIVLIALAYTYKGPLRKWQNNLGKPKNVLANIKIDLVDKIEIINQDKTLILTKKNQKWKYDNSKDFYVDVPVMAKVFNELKLAAESEMELVSNNQERKSEFKTDDSGLKIKIYESGELVADFIVGITASDYFSSYISLLETDVTYAVKADLPGAFNPIDWRDFTIFSTPAEKINKIRFQYPNREFTIELKDGEWSGILPNKFSVSSEKIQGVLDIMSNLKAEKIPVQDFSISGLDKHLIIIEASGEGINNTLMVGSENSDELYYAKKGDSDNLYLISKTQRNELDKSSWQLK